MGDRDGSGRFAPGTSGNPGGRSRLFGKLRDALQRLFPTIDEDILREMHWLAFNREHRDQKFALEWIADHLYGKALPAPPEDTADAPGLGGLSISIAPAQRGVTSTSTSSPPNSEPSTPSSNSESGTSQ